MSLVPLASLPGESRVWCFGASERPSEGAIDRLRASMEEFLHTWTAHRADLRAGFDWVQDRFLVIAVDESDVAASGCSIDALTGAVRELEGSANVTLLDTAPIWYRDGSGAIRQVDREEFRRLAERGDVGPATTVFDITVQALEDVRTGAWEVEAGRSWHARLL